VAHQDIDIANPKSNKKSAGFTKEERRDFGQVLDSGFVDTFRHQNPDVKQFTWWSARFNCRAKNIGWRLDYFVVSKDFLPLCGKAFVRPNVPGSDHCPIGLLVKQN
jgi:exodeoxyribonuclease-3